LPVQPTKPRPRITVTADGEHLVSHAGCLLLAETADTVGLTCQLGRRANLGRRAGGRNRGVVLRDLVVMLADGGDGFCDLASLRDQPELFGEVCSTSTAWRVVTEEVAADPRGIAGLWSALARARETAWALGAAPAGPLVLDIDATLVAAHSDKQGAAPTYKQGFGFHPLCCYLDRGDGTGEALSGILRPATPGPTPPPTMSRCSRWPCWPCPNRPGPGRSWSGPTRPAPPTPSSMTCTGAALRSRSGSRWRPT
jgi:hypothetical protein